MKWSNYSLVTQQIHWPYQPKQSPSDISYDDFEPFEPIAFMHVYSAYDMQVNLNSSISHNWVNSLFNRTLIMLV